MEKEESALAGWTPEQIARGKEWAATWKRAGEELWRIERKELRELDVQRAIRMLCGHADYTKEPYAPAAWSGLVEQQRAFMRGRGRA